MAHVLFLQGGPPSKGVYALLQQFVMSVLSDYSETAPEDIADLAYELAKAGFRMHDMTCSADPELRGVLIYRREKDSLSAIAHMKTPRQLRNGVAVDICRFDKENRIDTFEVKLANPWN
jgi:hypothetical protein